MSFKASGNGASQKSISNYKLLNLGDVAFEGHTNKQFSYGRFVVNDTGDGIMSPRFASISPKFKPNVNYWKFYLHNERIMNHVLVKSTKAGTMMNELVYSDLFKQSVNVPSEMEQNKIGNFLSKLEDTITLYQRKLQQFKQVQKAILEKALPKNNRRPQLGFTNSDWIETNFSDFYRKSIQKNDGSISKNKVISVAHMKWGDVPKNSSLEYMKTYYVLKPGDIAFEGNRSEHYSFGRFVENDLGIGIVSHVFNVYRPIKPLDKFFWKYYINNEQVMRNILRMSTIKTTMMTNLVHKDLIKQKLLIPDNQEQQRLGKLFNQTTELIDSEKNKVQKFKQLKKFLLQQMFV